MNYQNKTKLKELKDIFLKNEDRIVLITGFILVSIISFGIGRLSVEYQPSKPPMIIDDRNVKFPDTENISSNIGGAADQEKITASEAANTETPSGKIIGNKKSMIYHVPGGRFYDSITQENRIYFSSEEEAKKAGYRRSKL